MKVRHLLALALAALLAPGVASAAKSRPAAPAPAAATSASPIPGLSVGGFLGYESGDLSGLSLRLDGEVPFQALSPQVNLSWVGSLGYSHLTNSKSIPFGSIDLTENVIKIVPAARFSLPVNPQFTVFGDAGLGLYWASMSMKESATIPFFGSVSYSASASKINLMMRFAAGAWYQVNPKLRLGAMLELDPMFGGDGPSVNGFSSASFGQTPWMILGGAMFKI